MCNSLGRPVDTSPKVASWASGSDKFNFYFSRFIVVGFFNQFFSSKSKTNIFSLEYVGDLRIIIIKKKGSKVTNIKFTGKTSCTERDYITETKQQHSSR